MDLVTYALNKKYTDKQTSILTEELGLVLPTSKLVPTPDDNSVFNYTKPLLIELVEGAEYDIDFNGTLYPGLKAKLLYSGCFSIGAETISDGIPFQIITVPSQFVEQAGAYMQCYTATPQEKCVLKIKRSGGSNVQSDWNQNDPTAADYVKNRTHYCLENEETLLSSSSVSVGFSMGYVWRNIPPTSTFVPFEVGKTYTILRNGIPVQVECQYANSLSSNSEIHGARSSISADSSTQTYNVYTDNGSENDVWEVIGMVSIPQPLDEKYIPTAIARKTELASVATTGEYVDLKNKPALFSGEYNDLINAPTFASLTGYKINHILSEEIESDIKITEQHQFYNYTYGSFTFRLITNEVYDFEELQNSQIRRKFITSGTISNSFQLTTDTDYYYVSDDKQVYWVCSGSVLVAHAAGEYTLHLVNASFAHTITINIPAPGTYIGTGGYQTPHTVYELFLARKQKAVESTYPALILPSVENMETKFALSFSEIGEPFIISLSDQSVVWSPVSDNHINSLIEDKLGVIENASY